MEFKTKFTLDRVRAWMEQQDPLTLNDLQTHAAYLLTKKKLKLGDYQMYAGEMMYDGVTRYLYDQYKIQVMPIGVFLKNHDNYKLFANAESYVSEFRMKHFNFIKKTQSGAIMFLLGRMLASYVAKSSPPNVPINIGRVFQNARYIGAAVDHHFPGYISAGMANVVFDHMLKKIKVEGVSVNTDTLRD